MFLKTQSGDIINLNVASHLGKRIRAGGPVWVVAAYYENADEPTVDIFDAGSDQARAQEVVDVIWEHIKIRAHYLDLTEPGVVSPQPDAPLSKAEGEE